VQRAIDSVLNQTYSNVEVVAVDDGSTDETRQVLRSFEGERVHVLTRDVASGGPALPRSMAMSQSTGDLIALIDQDDFWLPGKLERQIEAFTDGIDLVYSDGWVHESSSCTRHSTQWGVESPSGEVTDALLRGNFIPAGTVVVRASAAHAVGQFGRGGVDLCDDYDFWLRIALNGGQFGDVDEPLAVHVKHGGNIMLTRYDEVRENYATMWSSLRRDYPGAPGVARAQGRERRRNADSGLWSSLDTGLSLSNRFGRVARSLGGPPTRQGASRWIAALRRKLFQ
jgi:glycosyltransferase involved in cell wall biosynthesis